MNLHQLNSLSTAMIAFTGFLIGIATITYYIYQIKKEISVAAALIWVNVYILINILFLYFIKGVLDKK